MSLPPVLDQDHPDHPAASLTASGRPRIAALDVIRGFALCGILVANVEPIANRGAVIATTKVPSWEALAVDQRFFPIFSFLFGVGFSLLLESATRRAVRPRLVLLRRLLMLLGLGLLHHFLLWQGDILTIYAIVGLLVLLPSTWLPRVLLPFVTAALLAVPFVINGGYESLVPGLFLLGSTLTRFGVIDKLSRATWQPALLGSMLLAAAIPLDWLQGRTADQRPFGAAGLLTAATYVCALLVILKTPARRAVIMIFQPLGRMALTNYLSATILVLIISARLPGPPAAWSSVTLLSIAAGILTLQRIWSGLWLRRYRQGPLEWLWRWVTFGRRPALRSAAG